MAMAQDRPAGLAAYGMEPLMHVTVDGRRGWKGPPDWMRDRAIEFCLDAIRLANMTLIDGPHGHEVGGQVYAQAMLAESHVQAHLDVDRSLAYLEMFSCNDFDEQGFVNLCRAYFNLERVRVQTLDRGLRKAGA